MRKPSTSNFLSSSPRSSPRVGGARGGTMKRKDRKLRRDTESEDEGSDQDEDDDMESKEGDARQNSARHTNGDAKSAESLPQSEGTTSQVSGKTFGKLRLPWDKSLEEVAEILGCKKPKRFQEQAEKIETLDAFQTFHLRCRTLSVLPNLKSATIIQAPSFGEIQLPGAACQRLEHLWLVDCKIEVIQNLDHLSLLKTLVLDSNDIREISGLSKLVSLRKLWINDNKIREVKGLENLIQLKNLSLARNRIEEIGDSLDPNQKLQELNLSHNRIGHFKELLSLRRLGSLQWLALSDPHWGSNPVCRLCNYQTFVLYQLPQVEILDTVPVSPEVKNVAEATYMKKHMYYNMRIKTLKRNTTNIINRAKNSLTRHARSLETLCYDLYLKRGLSKRDIEERIEVHGIFSSRDEWCDAIDKCEQGRIGINSLDDEANKLLYNEYSFIKKYRDNAIAFRDAVESKEQNEENKGRSHKLTLPSLSKAERKIMQCLTTAEWDHYLKTVQSMDEKIRKVQQEAAMLRARYQSLQERLINIASRNTSRMLLELGTGGNIRLEDGKPSDVWFNSCVDLLKSRFYKQDFARLGIKGVRVHRVTRIHNRLLRTKFDERMNNILRKYPELSTNMSAASQRSGGINQSNGSKQNKPRRPLEYLFYSPEWEGKSSLRRAEDVLGEVQKISEEGFKKSHATITVPSPPLVPDVNYAKEELPSYAPKHRRFGKQRSIAELDEQHRAAENAEALQAVNSSLESNSNLNTASIDIGSVWTRGIPFSNSLASIDLPRVAEASASLLEKHTEWKRSNPSFMKAGTGSVRNSSVLNKLLEPSVASSTSRTTVGPTGFKAGANSWIYNAGINPHDKETLQLLQSAARNDTKEGLYGGAVCDGAPDIPITEPAVCDGVLIICKVFLGHCDTAQNAAVSYSDYIERLKSTINQAAADDSNTNEKTRSNCDDDTASYDSHSSGNEEDDGLTDTLPPALHTVVQEREDDSKQKQWVSIDPVLALPEYIVEYEYLWQGQKPGSVKQEDSNSKANVVHDELERLEKAGLRLEVSKNLTEDHSNIKHMQSQEEEDLKPLVRAASTFTSHIEKSAERIHALNSGNVMSWIPKSPVTMASEDMNWSCLLEHQVSRLCQLGMKWESILNGPIEFDETVFQRLAYLNLSGCGLSSTNLQWTDKVNRQETTESGLFALSACVPNLRILVLSFNSIEKIPSESLSRCTKLKRLDLSHNLITEIERGSLFPCSARKAERNGKQISASTGETGCFNLTTVLLNHNEFCRWQDLGDIFALENQLSTLDLRQNPLTELQDALPDAFKNLSDDERAKVLHSSVPGSPSRNLPAEELKGALSLREAARIGAASSVQSTYRSMLIRTFSNLKCLDGVPVTSETRRKAMELTTYVSDELIWQLSHDRNGDSVWTVESSTSEDFSPDDKYLLVYSLDVSRRHLHSLIPVPTSWGSHDESTRSAKTSDLSNIPLKKLERLRKLDASCNDLTEMKGVGELKALESLCLEDNKLEKIEGMNNWYVRFSSLLHFMNDVLTDIKGMCNLSILELGKNRLHDHAIRNAIQDLTSLTNLVQLSLEDNFISDLKPFANLTNLMELYLGNNSISGIKQASTSFLLYVHPWFCFKYSLRILQVLHLRELPRLIILDLAGNPIVRNDSYRLYTIFNLRRLKVLDGLGVDVAEAQAAKEEYSGRLTLDFLTDKLNDNKFDSYHEIDLSGCQLREIDTLSPSAFRCLAMLNLDQNLLTGSAIKGLRLLPHLSILNLNGNKIDNLIEAAEDPLSEEEQTRYDEWFQMSSPPRPTTGDSKKVHAPSTPVCFPQLEVLNLDNNQITSMQSLRLHAFPELKVLSLANNAITTVSALNGCGQLREIILDKNKIRQIDQDSFKGAPDLCEVRLADNCLKNLNNIENLSNVQTLIVTGNRISDFADIDKLTSLPHMTEIALASNPISRKHLYRVTVIKKLDLLETLDSIPVTEEEKDQEGAYVQEQYRIGQTSQQASILSDPDQAMADRVPLRLQAVDLSSQSSARENYAAAGRSGSIELSGIGYPGGANHRQSILSGLESLNLGLGQMNSGRPRKFSQVTRNNFRRKDFVSR